MKRRTAAAQIDAVARQVAKRIRRCLRCEAIWVGRNLAPPKQCPRCRSPYWNQPRVRLPKAG